MGNNRVTTRGLIKSHNAIAFIRVRRNGIWPRGRTAMVKAPNACQIIGRSISQGAILIQINEGVLFRLEDDEWITNVVPAFGCIPNAYRLIGAEHFGTIFIFARRRIEHGGQGEDEWEQLFIFLLIECWVLACFSLFQLISACFAGPPCGVARA